MLAARLRQARLIAGLSQDQLVSRLNDAGLSITKAAISKYETGKSLPSAPVILKLAQVLKVKTDYFLSEPTLEVQWLAFRRHSTMTVTAQERVQHYAAQVAERQLALEALLYPDEQPEFPQVRRVTSPDEAEAAAADLRTAWQLDNHPIDNLFQTVEDHGGVVVEWHEDIGTFDGLSGWGNNTAPLAVINMRTEADRRRFSLAHELGHLLMNSETEAPKRQEKLAQRFAAALLVPAQTARHELGNQRQHIHWEELALLKQKYGMSMGAWIYRAKDLGIISDRYSVELWQEMKTNGWWKREPSDYIGIEQPSRLRQMTLRAVAEGLITEAQGRTICPDCFGPLMPVTQPAYPSARDLLKLPAEQRHQLVREALERSQTEDVEIFEAYSEENVDDYSPPVHQTR